MYQMIISLCSLEFLKVRSSEYDKTHSAFTCSKSKMETPSFKVRNTHENDVNDVVLESLLFEKISYIFLVLSLLTLNK